MTRSTFCICALLVPLLLGTAGARETPKPGPWSLEDCVKTALENQTDVLTARNNVTIARSRSARALSDYLPQVSVQNNAFRIGQARGVLTQTTTGTALNISQNIFDGGLREANALNARYGIKQNQAGLTRTVQTVIFDVTRAYYEVLRARHLAEVAEASVKYNEELRRQIQEQVKEGKSAEVDILPIEAQLANARVSLLSAQNAVRTAAIELQNTMGLSPQPGFDVREPEAPTEAEIATLDAYAKLAQANRPDIAQSQASLGAAKATARAARVSLYPRPVVSGDYQRQISGGFTTSGTQIVGGLVFDLFSGGANRAAYNEARANQANAELQQQQVLKDISAQVEEAYLNLTNAKERTAASTVSLDAARKNYDAQQARYGQGLGITLDLLNAEAQVITAQANEVQARYDYYIAQAQMDYATGRHSDATLGRDFKSLPSVAVARPARGGTE